MKNLIKFILIITMGLFLFTSCEDEESVPTIEHVKIWHAKTQKDVHLLKQPEVNDTASIVLEWTGKELTSDKQIVLNVVESQTTAKEDAHYRWINKTVTLKAGQRFTTVDIFEVIHANFMVSETVDLTLRLDSESEVPVYGADRITYNLKLRNVCPKEIEDFVGTWSVTDVVDGAAQAPYEVNITHMSGDTMNVSGFAAYAGIFSPLPDIIITLDLTPGEESMSIPYQHYATHSSVGPLYVVSPHSSGIASSVATCDMKMFTSYNVCTPSNICYTNWWTTESVWTKVSSKTTKNLESQEYKDTHGTLIPFSK